MPVNTQVSFIYNNSKVVPCPLVSFERSVEKSTDGTTRRKFWTITINGFTLPGMGSPLADGSLYSGSLYPPDTSPILTADLTFDVLKLKMAALSKLFSEDGHYCEFQPPNGGQSIRFQPRWTRFAIPEGKFFNNFTWTLTGEADYITPFDLPSTQLEITPEEQWSTERMDDVGRLMKLSHTVSIAAKKKFNSTGGILCEGWQLAKDIITGGPLAGTGAISFLGYDAAQGSGASILGLTGYNPYNYIRGQQIDKAGGKATVTESWELFNNAADNPTGLSGGQCVEEVTCDNSYSNETGLTSVHVNGTIRGLEETNPTTYAVINTRYYNASLRAAGLNGNSVKTIAQNISGIALNPNPLSLTISRNKISGVITYSGNFDNRLGLYDSNNTSELVTIEFDNAASEIARIPIPFRAAGPILQNVGTVTASTITISVEIVRPVLYGSAPVVPAFNMLAKALQYINYVPTSMFMIRDTPRFVEGTGRFSRSTTFLYQ